jgi:hypothetical protein
MSRDSRGAADTILRLGPLRGLAHASDPAIVTAASAFVAAAGAAAPVGGADSTRPRRIRAVVPSAVPSTAGTLRVVPCPICGLRFTIGPRVNNHLLIHAGECATVPTDLGHFITPTTLFDTLDAVDAAIAEICRVSNVYFKKGTRQSDGAYTLVCPNFARSLTDLAGSICRVATVPARAAPTASADLKYEQSAGGGGGVGVLSSLVPDCPARMIVTPVGGKFQLRVFSVHAGGCRVPGTTHTAPAAPGRNLLLAEAARASTLTDAPSAFAAFAAQEREAGRGLPEDVRLSELTNV